LILIFLVILSAQCWAQGPKDEINKVIIKQETDWNKNDMLSYANSFTDDGTIINFLGLFWKGKSEIITQFKLINDCCIKPTQVKLDIADTHFLNDQTAIVYIKETLTAKQDYQVPGKILKKGTTDNKMITAIFIKQENSWKIRSMQVTQIVPLPPR
ncbi:MAG: SgcJ/EcaC family oxidoreductase, partial [Flavobacterium sp.]